MKLFIFQLVVYFPRSRELLWVQNIFSFTIQLMDIHGDYKSSGDKFKI